MNYDATNPVTDDFALALDEPWTAYWLAFLRFVTGWWFFHAGLAVFGLSGAYELVTPVEPPEETTDRETMACY
jgi:uncharacterized membrane protein YphA (DoxX/SURF4 family)